MPVYEYECSSCKHRFERTQRFSDPPVQECPECGSAVRKVLFPAGIVFKGSGWYSTDSRPSPPADGASTDPTKSEAPDSKAGSSGAKAESSGPAKKSESAASTTASG